MIGVALFKPLHPRQPELWSWSPQSKLSFKHIVEWKLVVDNLPVRLSVLITMLLWWNKEIEKETDKKEKGG